MDETRSLRLRYTRPALADPDSILGYIEDHSPRGARRVQARIQSIIGLITQFPRIGRRTNDPTIRRVVVTPYPYLVFYEATEPELIVHAVRHAARNPSGMPGSGRTC